MADELLLSFRREVRDLRTVESGTSSCDLVAIFRRIAVPLEASSSPIITETEAECRSAERSKDLRVEGTKVSIRSYT